MTKTDEFPDDAAFGLHRDVAQGPLASKLIGFRCFLDHGKYGWALRGKMWICALSCWSRGHFYADDSFKESARKMEFYSDFHDAILQSYRLQIW